MGATATLVGRRPVFRRRSGTRTTLCQGHAGTGNQNNQKADADHGFHAFNFQQIRQHDALRSATDKAALRSYKVNKKSARSYDDRSSWHL